MPNFNQVNLIGHLTRDTEKRSVGDKTVVKTGIAVNGWKPGDVMFIDLTAWNKTGEALAKVSKGQAVGIVGRLQLETWDDKNGGGKRSKHSVTVDQVIFLGNGRQQEQPTTAEPVNDPAAEETNGEGSIPF